MSKRKDERGVFAVRRGDRFVAVVINRGIVEAETSLRVAAERRQFPQVIQGRGPAAVAALLALDVRTFASLRELRAAYGDDVVRRPEFDVRDLIALTVVRARLDRNQREREARGQGELLTLPSKEPEKRARPGIGEPTLH